MKNQQNPGFPLLASAACYKKARTALARNRRRLGRVTAVIGAGLIVFGWWWGAAWRVELTACGVGIALFGAIHSLIERRRRPNLLLGRLVKKECRRNISVGDIVTMQGKPFMEPWLRIEVRRQLSIAPDGTQVDLPPSLPFVEERVYAGVYDRIREGEDYVFLYSPSGTFLGYFDGVEFVGD